MDAKQLTIMKNELELNKLREQLGILPRMDVLICSSTPTKSTFNLRDLNRELINNKQ